MLSLHQAIEIRESILAYLKATFSFQDKEVHRAFYDFVNHPKNGLFKGPYLNISLPFVKANEEEQASIPLDIKPPWAPYDHQVKSWHRLSTKDQIPKPTIITTGTGSGKTESFMYPILDYCYKNYKKQGIKVIILYPMNALATDQAKRLAQAIYEDERTRGKISAGLFIGEGKDAQQYPKTMGEDHIIENRESILQSPPDILLTNFKMLDYGLLKSNYNDLWIGNYKDTELLKFLVLDELHTYDGAQGTDVANLIRRLKLKLEIPKGQLCPVGTSATIGSGPEASVLLSEYASKVFGEKVSSDCIITENRLSVDQFFKSEYALEKFTPRISILKDVKPNPGEGYEKYIERQVKFWQVDGSRLSDELLNFQIVKDLIEVVNRGKGNVTLTKIIKNLSNQNQDFKSIPQWDEQHRFSPKEAIILSLVSLISDAKIQDEATGRRSPFLYIRTQLWVRELSGVLRVMDETPLFTWKSEVDQKDSPLALPPWFCRECGASGWLGVKHDNKERFEKDINDVYQKYFSNHKHIFFANRTSWYSLIAATNNGYETEEDNVIHKHVYGRNLEFYDQPDKGRVDLTAFRKLNDRGYNDHVCPECNTRNTLAIIGTRIATLSSVSVSQVIASDLDKQTEQKRKVLAFTNSVQDAAHQAGFIEARNYRFTFRSSLQKVINQQTENVSLEELTEKFIDYWKEHAHDSSNKLDAYYFRFYPTDYMGKSSPKDYLDKGQYYDHFQEEFDLRVSWEILSEFGYNALIGRTLEKTESSGVQFSAVSLKDVYSAMQSWLSANDTAGIITEEKFVRFVCLVLHRIRTRGAVSHPYLDKFRNGLHTNSTLHNINWNKDSRHFLNKKFGRRSRLPKLISNQPDTRGLVDSTFSKKVNWFHAYFKKTFELASDHTDFVNEFYKTLLEKLTLSGILDKVNEVEFVNFAIKPAQLYVSKKMEHYKCSACEHELHLASSSLELEEGKCLNYRCQGSYEKIDRIDSSNYYQLVYNRNLSPRIYSTDHTGLLERKVRENVENDFKKRPNFNSKNVMVATSTLEMGIDIGDLNTAFNNAIPPMPSNFLQRIGRAGRASGSALIVNFAKSSQSHDLFYFIDPHDMMNGEVATPGCYLEAKEILKRHFFAYCIDRWTKEDPKNHAIPYNIKYLKLQSSDLNQNTFFINKILSYIKANEETIISEFKSAYKSEVKGEVFSELKEDLISDSFYNQIKSVFLKLKDEIAHVKLLQREIDQRIKELNLGKEDPERKELESERKNLGGIIHSIRKRVTLEHMTNEGTLPNYAFPEKGVSLSAKVMGNQAEGSTKPPMNKDFELVRSASQAIKELAPDNYFYSQGFKFLISGINTFDWADDSNFHNKRFCSNCDHLEVEDLNTSATCPKCGDESWGAASNVHRYAKLLSVKSFNNQYDATLNDGSDERELILYNKQEHFNFSNGNSYGAFAMKNIPFGIEFVKNVEITTSNVGRQDVSHARKVKINDNEYPAHGFVTCTYCGKSSSNFGAPNYRFHYGYCKHKDKTYNGIPNDVFEEVFFYRQLKTEVLKILLPVHEMNGDSEIKMFRAGLELGLRKYFKGNPQHIGFSEYREFNHTNNKFDRYLLLYDTIPGGTGYLQDLFKTKSFSSVIKEAYQTIKSCSCQHEGKDGCYRCIYSYSNQYYQEELSRAIAEKRFEKIVKQSEDWESYPGGLGNITNSGHIEESELEERFIRSLRNYCDANEDFEFEEINDDGTISYVFNYISDSKSVSYHIRPQLSLGNLQGIKLNSRPDFTFICTKFEYKGIAVDDIYALPRIVIFLDGYQYHASKEHNIFHKDVEKRNAISESPNYLVWTLTWNDVEIFDALLGTEIGSTNQDFIQNRVSTSPYLETKKLLEKATQRSLAFLDEFESNLHRLMKVLFNVNNLDAVRKDIALYLGYFQKKAFYPSFDPSKVYECFQEPIPDNYCIRNKTLNGLVPSDLTPMNYTLATIQSFINIDQGVYFSKIELKDTENIEVDSWNIYWLIYNLLQFGEQSEVSKPISKQQSSIPLEDILEVYESTFHPQIKELYHAGLIKDDKDELKLECLLDNKDQPIAYAMFVYQSEYAVEPVSEESRNVFKSNGFKIYSLDEFKNKEI